MRVNRNPETAMGAMVGLAMACLVIAPSARSEGTEGASEAPLNLLNPRITVFGNAALRMDDHEVATEDGDRIDDSFNLRETELDFRAAVDPFADGVVILTAESESPGKFEMGIEEGYVILKAVPWLERMPLGLKFKAGRFRAAMGQFNIIHLHDLPQSTLPLVLQEFLGEEGLISDGLSAAATLPLWEDHLALSPTLQISNDTVVPGTSSYVGRLQLYSQLSSTHSLTLGASARQAHASASDEAVTAIGDVLYKWKPLRGGEWRSFLLGGEWATTMGLNEADRSGYYAFAQYQLSRPLYAGVRWDMTRTEWTIDSSAEIPDGPVITVQVPITRKNRQITPYVTYYFSEFLRFRASWERTWPRDDTFWLELNFIVGSHPAEPFWVNK